MALGPSDLVLCSGTLPREVPFATRLAAAKAGGFAGISLWGRDYWAARRTGLSDVDIRLMLSDHGLAVAEIDPGWWWLPGASEVHIPVDADREEVFRYGETEVFRIADAVGARSLNAVDVFGGEWTLDEASERFATLCDRSAEHGLLVHLEFLPWSRIPDLSTAWEVVSRAERPNGGVAVDSWHWFRGGGDDAALRAIPGESVLGVQLSDGPANAETNLVHATLHERLVPGEGQFDLDTLVGLLRQIGAYAPIGVEVFSDDLHRMPPEVAATRVADATRRLIAT
jgi:sugar phosphate isomerase/epimerase